MIVKLLTEYHLEFLSLKGGCRGSSESTLVKMSNCWKSHAAAHLIPVLWYTYPRDPIHNISCMYLILSQVSPQSLVPRDSCAW